MTFANPIPWWGLAALLAVAAWLAWGATAQRADTLPRWQRLALSALRVAAVALIVALVMRPVRIDPPGAASARLAVVVDRSVSMGVRDASGRSRLDAAVDLVRRLRSTLPARIGVETYALGSGIETTNLDDVRPDAARTDLDAALGEFRGRTPPVAAMLLVTDGAFDVGAEVGRGLPVSVVPVGGTARGPDRGVIALSIGEPIASDELVDLGVTVVQDSTANEPFDLRVAADGSPVETRRVSTPGRGVPAHALFRVAPAPDRPTTFTVEVAPLPDEVTTLNNRAAIVVPPPGGPRKVLVIEGGPGHEHSFLKRAWLADRGLLIDAVVRKGATEAGPPAYYLQTATEGASDLARGFPSTLAALCRYDVVVLANVGADTLTTPQLEQLAYFVGERGGGLVVLGRGAFDARASRGTPLDELLPLDSSAQWRTADIGPASGTGVTLLPAGTSHPVMRLASSATETLSHWAGLPALAEVFPYGGPRPGASVLAVAPAPGGVQLPLAAIQTYGRGRVLAFTGEASWRWKMQMPSADRTFETFWRQAVRWAAARQGPVAVSVRTDLLGRLAARVTVRSADFAPVADADVTVAFVRRDGSVRDERPVPVDPSSGTYEVTRAVSDADPVRISVAASRRGQTLGTAETWWAPSLDHERASPWRDDGTLRRVAELTGGRVLEPGEVARWAGALAAGSAPGLQGARQDLWHRWWVLSGLVALLSLEWMLRRRWGLR